MTVGKDDNLILKTPVRSTFDAMWKVSGEIKNHISWVVYDGLSKIITIASLSTSGNPTFNLYIIGNVYTSFTP